MMGHPCILDLLQDINPNYTDGDWMSVARCCYISSRCCRSLANVDIVEHMGYLIGHDGGWRQMLLGMIHFDW